MTPTDFQALRKSMGHTQHTLAESLGMGAHGWQTISAWENGKRDIPGPVKIAMDHLANCQSSTPRRPPNSSKSLKAMQLATASS